MVNTTLFTMSLITDFKYIFTESYPSSSPEELQLQLESLQNDMKYIVQRKNHLHCTCKQEEETTHISVLEHKDGRCKVRFQNILLEDMCERCQKTLADFPSYLIGAGISPLDHWHPRLLLETAQYQEGLLQKAIFCKQKNYIELSNDELKYLAIDTEEEGRYLRRQERKLSPVPEGLLDAIDTNEEEIRALEFETKSRALRGLIELDLTSSVQSDTD